MKQRQLFQKPMLLFFFCVATSLSYTQVTEQWVKRYNGPQNFLDEASSLVTDASGNVYVTGGSYGSNNNYDYATIKYTAAGIQLWAKRYDGPAGPGSNEDRAYAIAVDASGNVYVTGYSYSNDNQEDYLTIKYNAAGAQLWVKRYDGPAHSSDRAFSMAVDSVGNVYVTGFSFGMDGTYDYATIKYSTAGAVLWVQRYNSLVQDQATALAVDALGNVYVTGYSYSDPSLEDYATIKYTTVKYSTQGTEVWVRNYVGPYGGSFASSLAVDASGNVYVTGQSSTDRNDEQISDYATVKYNAAGAELWVKRYNGNGNSHNEATALAIDAFGNVYVTGSSYGSGTNADYATIKYNTAGNQLWVKRYNGPGNSNDAATSLAIDGAGNVYVTGFDYENGSDNNYATIKYDAAGNQVWIQRYNGPGNSYDAAADLTVDALGNVYVTGQSYDSTTVSDYATIKYAQVEAATVSSFTLINADTDTAIRKLKNGDTINLTTLATLNLNIRANTNPSTVGSVVFSLCGAELHTQTENIVPYALFADNKGDYNGWTPTNGNYTLTATPYSGSKGDGSAGTPLTIHFTVTGQVVSSLVLVNAETDQDIKTLQNSDVIDLATLPTTKLNVRAVVHPDTVGSVVFNLNNKVIVWENLAPYAIGGDIRGDYRAWTLPIGKHSLTATPYEGKYGKGKKGKIHSVTFTVIDKTTFPQNNSANSHQAMLDVCDAGESLSATPNPFVGQTTIRFSVRQSGYTTLQVYDIKGMMVARLYQAQVQAGKWYSVLFNSKQLAAGLYVTKLTNGKQIQSYKLVLIR